jgi:hypothetical protein
VDRSAAQADLLRAAEAGLSQAADNSGIPARRPLLERHGWRPGVNR